MKSSKDYGIIQFLGIEKCSSQYMGGVNMEVIELADESRGSCPTICVLAWYIAMKKYKILFATGEPGNFWQCTKAMKVPMDKIDMLFLSQGCQDSLRELECFLRYNNKAKIYLPRENNEAYLCSVYNKLLSYTAPEHVCTWKKRIIFMDKFMKVGNDVQIITEEGIQSSRHQNLILNEDGIKVLFVNGRKNIVERVQMLSETAVGHHMNYFFYSEKQRDNVRNNCITGGREVID